MLLAVAAPVLALGVVLGLVYERSAKTQVQQQYVDKARAVVLGAESAREEMAAKWKQGLFNATMLRDWAAHNEPEKVLAAVPVVTAWRVAQAKAAEGGYELRVPKFQPRNPKNEPDPFEARILHKFEKENLSEYYEIDAATNAVRYFRPIRLTEECLLCHGDPKNSQANWGNDKGLDPTGAAMENWSVGEVHGAFEVVQSLKSADATRASMLMTFLLIILGCLAVSLGLAYWLTRRSIVRPLNIHTRGLNEGATQVVMAAQHVASSSQTLARGAVDQAAALEETSAAMEEMSSMNSRNAETARDAAALMRTVGARVADANTALAFMVESMGAMKASSQSVSRIIRTIDEIAFQTNILALNAAVEAARAGEAGMGFAVVADEVRNLAQRSAKAAKETEELIADSIEKAGTGSSHVQVFSESIGEITTFVNQVKGLIDDVSDASSQQSQGLSQVTQSIQQMERVTQSNAAAAEEAAAASEELNSQAESTQDIARHLDELIGGRRLAAGARSVARIAAHVSPGRAVSSSGDGAAADFDEPRTGTYN